MTSSVDVPTNSISFCVSISPTSLFLVAKVHNGCRVIKRDIRYFGKCVKEFSQTRYSVTVHHNLTDPFILIEIVLT